MPKRSPLLTGGCQCGAVRYALYAMPTDASICHCRMCQKAFGNYFAPFTGIARRDFAWTRGEPGIFRSSEIVERGFCPNCGTPLSYSVLTADRISVSVGSLDEPERVRIEKQYGIEGRLPAFATLHDLPGESTEASTPPEQLAKLASRQHPDRE